MRRKNALLLFSSGGMMLSCLCTWTAFVMASLSHKPVSASEATGILLLSMIITGCHHDRRWRRLYVLGLHVTGLFLAALWLCHHYYLVETSFWRFTWTQSFFLADRGAQDWFALISILLCAGTLWFLGHRLVTSPPDLTTISHRFDIGLGVLLALLMIKLLIAMKGGVLPGVHSATMFIIAFVVLGLFSMGLVHIIDPPQSGGIFYLKGIGIVISFTTIALLLGGGFFILFLPELQAMAAKGADVLRTATAPLRPGAIALLRFFLLSGCRSRAREDVNIERAPAREIDGQDQINPQELISDHFITGLIVVIGLIVFGSILLHLFRRLDSQKDTKTGNRGILELWLSFVNAALQLLFFLTQKIFVRGNQTGAAAAFYTRLLNWGRCSGVRYVASETPREYAARLGHRFPNVKTEIYHVIHLHDATIYGGISPSPAQISRARAALAKMRHPHLWVARLKSLCFQNNY